MNRAKFTTGSTMRHVVAMTAAGGVGLIALFMVDALNLFYISLLGHRQLAAAIGFAGTVQFFTVSASIGFAIAASAVVSRAIGAGDHAGARRLAASAMTLIFLLMVAITAVAWVLRVPALRLLGAEGETLAIASRFLAIALLSLPFLGIGMISNGLLRAIGEGRQAMYVTLSGGAVSCVLDPILILLLGFGVPGAAVSIAIARMTFAGTGLWLSIRGHDLIGRVDLAAALGDARPILAIALPAVATQLSTPFGNAFLTHLVAHHGDEAVAGWAVVGRLTPLAFGVIFALAGSVGPIIGQNRGAGLHERLHMAYRDALIFAGCWVIFAWALLWLATGPIVAGFGLTGPGAVVAETFTHAGAGAFLFTGALFVSNAAFNNLGRPTYSTMFNWSRDAGAIPLIALVLGNSMGPGGAVLVQAMAAVLVGSCAAVAGWRFVGRFSQSAEPLPLAMPLDQPAFASGRAALAARPAAEEMAEEVAEEAGGEAASGLANSENTR